MNALLKVTVLTGVRYMMFMPLFLVFVSCSQPSADFPYKVVLQQDWKIQNSSALAEQGDKLSSSAIDTSAWYDATVPSTILGSLTRNNLYPDIFMGDNIKKIDKTQFDSSWWYRKEFTLNTLTESQYAYINFDGISYYANIWLNGKRVAGRSDVYGSFRRFNFDITKFVKEGRNVIAVEIFRQRPGDFGIGFVDWNPRPADESMGIWRDVYITVTNAVGIQNSFVESTLNLKTLDEASLTIKTELVNHSDKTVTGTLKGKIEAVEFEYPVTLAPHQIKNISLSDKEIPALHFRNPRLWWCNNLGKPELYTLNLQIEIEKKVSDSTHLMFGIRQVSDYYDEQGARGFLLNGKKVIIKGGGWTDDIFLRDSPESNETQVRYVKDMNLNTIRLENIWGTSQNLYDVCDQYGIMVMVGWTCHWEWEVYVGKPCNEFGGIQTEEEMSLMVTSLEDQVKWLRYHPSIISWFVGSDKLPKPVLEERYKKLLSTIDSRPYLAAAANWKSTVSGPTGVKMNGPYEYEGPNYWYVDKENGGAFGFNTETGPGPQIPVKETILKMIPQNKLWPLNDAWNFHCTTAEEAFNTLDVFNEAVTARFGKATTLDDYLVKSSATQYEAMRAMFEAFRGNQAHTTGIVQWMLNSAWPSLYWHLYDYYLHPTSAYYAVKKANEPLQLIYNYGNNAVYAVSDLNSDTKNMTAKVQLFDRDSKLIKAEDFNVSINQRTTVRLCELAKIKDVEFLSLELYDEQHKKITSNFYWLSARPDEYHWDKTTWAYTPMKSYADFTSLTTLPACTVNVAYEKTEQGDNWLLDITLHNGKTIAFFSTLVLQDSNGQRIRPVYWSDNYLSLTPDQTTHVTCLVAKKLLTPSTTLTFSGWNAVEQKLEVK